MEQYYPIIADAILLIIVALIVWRSARRGFVRTVIELVGYIAAAAIAFSAAGVIADTVYNKNIRPSVISTVDKSLSSGTDTEDITQTVDRLWDSLPSVLTALASVNGMDKQTIKDNIEQSVSEKSAKVSETLADDIIKPVAVSAIRMITSLIIFVLLMILVKFLARLINKVFNIPVLRTVNQTLGGILGLLKGAIIAYVIITVLRLSLPLFGNAIGMVTPEMLEKTYIIKLLYNFRPIV